MLSAVEQVEDADKIADMIASHLAVKIPEKQDLLETLDVHDRLEKIFGVMEGEIGALQVEKRVRNRVKRQMEKTQREYYLNEQMKAIQKELGEGEDGMNELDEIEAHPWQIVPSNALDGSGLQEGLDWLANFLNK